MTFAKLRTVMSAASSTASTFAPGQAALPVEVIRDMTVVVLRDPHGRLYARGSPCSGRHRLDIYR